MGCIDSKRIHYVDTKYDEEIEVRKFEEEMGAFKKTLNNILPRICVESDLIKISALEDYIHTEFSENFSQLIRHDYFYKTENNEKYYDGKKIKLLLFLLTNDSKVSNSKITYHDKVNYLLFILNL
jgi:hypothetical protein